MHLIEQDVQPLDDSIRFIKLTQGKIAIVDKCNYDELIKFKWFAVRTKKHWSARRHISARNGATRHILFMHHAVIGKPLEGMEVDHVNRNPLDNRLSNLRFVTVLQNRRNKSIYSNNTSGFKGVNWNKKMSKYLARICIAAGKQKSLGYFISAEEAARAYDRAAILYYGQFAVINFPDK